MIRRRGGDGWVHARAGVVGEVGRHARAALDWVWPPVCVRCGARAECPQEQFCHGCWSGLRPLRAPDRVWRVDGVPMSAAFAVDSLFLELLTASKYRRVRPVGWRLAREAAGLLSGRAGRAGQLVPVPLTRQKFRERGFNQPEDFARVLSDLGMGPLRSDLLSRCRGGRALAGRRREDRAAAVAGAFRATASPSGAEGPLILVDDVITTGSTALACVQALRSVGWEQVHVVAMGRAFEAGRDRVAPKSDLWERL